MPAFTPHLNLYLPGGGSLGIGGEDETADIDKLNQDFQKIDTWATEVDNKLDDAEKQSYFTGTEAERIAMAPPILRDGIVFKTTDEHGLWDRYKGAWRKIAGTRTIAAGAWSMAQTSDFAIYAARTTNWSISYPIDADETIEIVPVSVGTGFGWIALSGVTRTETNTSVTIRQMQIGSLAQNPYTALWRIVPVGQS